MSNGADLSWRGYLFAAGALFAFFVGLALAASGVVFGGIDLLLGLLFAGGSAAAIYTYARVPLRATRRVAIIAMGLNTAALLLQITARL